MGSVTSMKNCKKNESNHDPLNKSSICFNEPITDQCFMTGALTVGWVVVVELGLRTILTMGELLSN